MDPIAISRRLTRKLGRMRFAAPVAHVYNPLVYARANHESYLKRYAHPGVEAVLLGMNPGPFGMVQTGVPFGEVEYCRDWLDISGPVKQPKSSHPKRPVQGFACTRREVSGRRLWGWAQERFGKPEAFFRRIFVFNYCPLAFLEDSGRNRTPDKLPAAEKDALFAACDEALAQTMDWLKPKQVVGIGAFAEKRAREALDSSKFSIGRILHPSPASPAANRGWAEQADAQLLALGVSLEPRP